mgnify:FL=1
MKLYPAIDVLDGRAVRLLYGKRDQVTDYGDPVDFAKRWADEGAEILHVVDLSGAFGEAGGFEKVLERIARVGVPVQSGGGLRSMADIHRRFRAGADRVVLGTVCVEHPEVLYEAVGRYKEKIVAGIDAKDGFLAVRGWTQLADKDAFEFGCEAKALGIADAVFTDIGRDGALAGVNVAETVRMGETGLNIIASGGVRDLNDIRALKEQGVYGVILGRALYTGTLTFKDAFEVS